MKVRGGVLAVLLAACAPSVPLPHAQTVIRSASMPGDSARSVLRLGNALLVYPKAATPTPLHRALEEMVARCLGSERPVNRLVGWGVADRIVDAQTGQPWYGMSAIWPDSTAWIIIERGYWLHPSVITHELIHVIADETADSPIDPVWRCEVRMPEGLERRSRIHTDTLRALQRLGGP